MSSSHAGEKRKAENGGENPVVKAEKGESSTSSSKATSASASASAAADEDPDWDDDRPICELMTEYMKKKVQRAKAKAKEEAEREAAAKAAKASKSSGSGGGTRTAAPQRKDAQYYDTLKGVMVQRLLVRWWYAYDWPLPGDWAESDIPNGYEQLDGFPGVFVSMNVSSLGKIVDLRNNDMKPSLKHMSKKHAREVQELCIRAYQAQIKALEEAEGEGAPLLHDLRRELHEVKKTDADAAEHSAKAFVF